MARRLHRLTERTAAPFAGCGKIDRDAGVIHDVLICGTVSENGRDYPPAVLRRDYAVYEGRPVNADHGKEATISRRLGWFSGVQPASDGRPRGTFNVLKSHPMYAAVMEAAERNPSLFGFSHVALCETKPGPNGREIVEAIKRVESIDLVAEPATTQGLFEGKAVTITIKQLLEKLAPKVSVEKLLQLKRLSEMDGMGDTAMDAPADDADPDDAMWSGFSAAINAVLAKYKAGDLDEKAATKAIGKYLKTHAKLGDGDGEDGDPPAEDSGDSEEKPKESKAGTSGAAILEALDAATKLGFRPDRDDLEIIAATPLLRREAVAKKLKAAADAEAKRTAGETPKSAGREGGARLDRATEGKDTTAAVATAKDFARSIRG